MQKKIKASIIGAFLAANTLTCVGAFDAAINEHKRPNQQDVGLTTALTRPLENWQQTYNACTFSSFASREAYDDAIDAQIFDALGKNACESSGIVHAFTAIGSFWGALATAPGALIGGISGNLAKTIEAPAPEPTTNDI